MPDPGADTVKIPQDRSRCLPRLAVWGSVTLGALCLLAGGGLFGGRWYVDAKLRSIKEKVKTESFPGDWQPLWSIGYREAPLLDYLPDLIVYPALLAKVEKGYGNDVALGLIEMRSFGGCRKVAGGDARFFCGKAVPGAKVWVAKLPREFLEDLYVAAHPQGTPSQIGGPPLLGSRLIRVLDPENPKWSKAFWNYEWRAAVDRLLKMKQPQVQDAGGRR